MSRRSPIATLCLTASALLAITSAAVADPLDAADDAFRAAGYRQAWTGPLGQTRRWANPATGHAGTVQAVKERIDPATRQPCREILETLTTGDQPATGYAVGCRGTDGTWQIVESSTATAGTKPATDPAPADVTPYVAPADISADGNNAPTGLPPQVRILIPWHGAAGVPPPAPR